MMSKSSGVLKAPSANDDKISARRSIGYIVSTQQEGEIHLVQV